MQTGVVLACSSCGQKNRVPWSKLDDQGKCGKCGSALPFVGGPVSVDSRESFEKAVAESELPVLVDFWAPWCGPCRMVAPELEKLAAQRAGKLLILKVNTQDLPQVGSAYGVRSIPTMALFGGGRELKRTAGARPAHQIAAWIDG